MAFIRVPTYLTAEGPDLSKTGGGPLALRAFNSLNVFYPSAEFNTAAANCFTFNSSSLALRRLIARAPNMISYLEEIFREEIIKNQKFDQSLQSCRVTSSLSQRNKNNSVNK